MALLTLAELRALVESDRTDAELTAIVAREEAEIARRFGAYGDGSTAQAVTLGGGGTDLYLPRGFVSISSVQERPSIAGSLQTVTSTSYATWPAQGRLTRLGGAWGAQVVVTYIPVDERDRFRAAVIDLVRLALSRTAYQAESVAGEHSYTAPNWEAARQDVYRRLRFTSI